ncbi:MAG: EutP/PduV family microcompartment system protein [Bacillota bacterium]|uniref:EutP/PduV family microcompartment system protein n=1 Tax=Desulfurispora thermophila TaxID=265470 RepID=UPI0004770147|nr:EutP/PduV family microcompartment system protein [Desulfurispora thermophila]
MSRIMVIGASEAGKSTLLNVLHGLGPVSSKTQALEFAARTVDTPGEYAENPRYYRALLATAMDVDYVLFVQDATRENCIFPPGMGQIFPGYTLGVVTKTDHPAASVLRAVEMLETVALKGDIIPVSALTGVGIDELKQKINWPG